MVTGRADLEPGLGTGSTGLSVSLAEAAEVCSGHSFGRGEPYLDRLERPNPASFASSSAREVPFRPIVDPRDVTVLLATINERASLPSLMADIERACGVGVQLVVVDDGSSDGTREFLQGASGMSGSLRCIFNSRPQTIVGAHVQGITSARTPYIIVMDSDGQHPPETIPRILDGLRQGQDVVIGTRFGPGGSTGGRTAFRGLVSRVAAFLIQVTVRNTRSISDPTSGFFGLRRESLEPFTRDLRGYETLVFVLAMMHAPRVAEVPYAFRERAGGESKVLRGFSFFRVFFTQLVAAKRTELDARRREAERSADHPQPTIGRSQV